MKNICAGMESMLAGLLLSPEAAPAKVLVHLESCEGCRRELEELRATMALLEAWEAPEPSPYFLSRLDARMREERAAEPVGWLQGAFAALRDRLAYGSGNHVRPLAAMALSLLLLVSGGAYLGVTEWNPAPVAPEEAAVVHDLQTMDSNAQLLDQLEELSSNSANGD